MEDEEDVKLSPFARSIPTTDQLWKPPRDVQEIGPKPESLAELLYPKPRRGPDIKKNKAKMAEEKRKKMEEEMAAARERLHRSGAPTPLQILARSQTRPTLGEMLASVDIPGSPKPRASSPADSHLSADSQIRLRTADNPSPRKTTVTMRSTFGGGGDVSMSQTADTWRSASQPSMGASPRLSIRSFLNRPRTPPPSHRSKENIHWKTLHTQWWTMSKR